MKNNFRLFLSVSLVLALVLSACSQPTERLVDSGDDVDVVETDSEPELVDEPQEKLQIAAVAAEVGIPFFTTIQCGAMAAAEEYNVDLYWSGPAEWDFLKQQTFIDGALALEPDGLILVPTDPNALVTYVETWMGEGLPVVTVDVTLEQPVELMGIESDQYSGGVLAAQELFEITKGEGSYYTVSTQPGSYGANQRVAGFVDTMLELNPDANVLETCYAHHDAAVSAECVSAAIIGNPDLKGVYVVASSLAAGAASAIIEQGQAGKIALVSYDADPQQVQDLRNGVYTAVIAQGPYQMGWLAVETLVKYLRGEVSQDEIEQHVNVPMMVLTQENIDDPLLAEYLYIGDIKFCPVNK